jgi:hypothetical protein
MMAARYVDIILQPQTENDSSECPRKAGEDEIGIVFNKMLRLDV